MGLDWGNSVKNFQSTAKKTGKNVEKEVQKLTEKTGRGILKDAIRLTPTDTGKLKRSWKKKSQRRKKQYEYTITNSTSYAIYVEHGSRKTPPRRMLSKAFNTNSKRMKKGLDRIIKKESNKWQQ